MSGASEKRSPADRWDASDLDRPPEAFAPSSTPAPGVEAGGGEPPTLSLMGRLFGVPLLIVGVMVGGALLVMLAFGEIASDSRRSVDSLLRTLESSGGERVAGALLPRDRELWQDARELAMRMADPKEPLSAQEMDQVVARLSSLVNREPEDSRELGELGRQRLHFFMTALSHTGSARAIGPIAARVEDPSPETRRTALISLGRMHAVPETRQALPQILPTLEDSDATVRTVACWVMSLLAQPTDLEIIEKLEKAVVAEDREVRWNAALTLARLGNDQACGPLLDMLDRGYWSKVPVRSSSAQGQVVESPMPAGAVEEYLIAAVDAAAHLDDAELRDSITALRQDSSPRVADRARAAMEGRGSGTAKD